MSKKIDEILEWLNALEFVNVKNNNWIKEVNGSTIEVDTNMETINYPDEIRIGRKTTVNFSQMENFVILETVIKLLKQGYRPSNIEIEKGYKLGRDKKAGNADITITDNNGITFMIIECKTFGDEFEKAWSKTLQDGGQIFSYEKQENTAQVIMLYASRVYDNQIESIYHAISLKDNEEFLATLEDPLTFKDTKGGDDKFTVWKQTYQYDYIVNGVLEEDIEPYTINKPKKTVNDLKDIKHEEVQKKYNEFASILRKYNIGGRENAFDKLVNLFLAKIVDEQENPEDLQFIWKGVAQDTYFELVDRLQKLYQIGMQKFLDETVTYVAESDVKDAFRLNESAAKDAVLDYFKQLKYFSNSDFAFLEVYNENLFYQNSRILVEIVKMFQEMRLQTDNQNQFLGDLFEGFLDNGVKQSEGQFFTPLPIVKFIVSSLPLKELTNQPDPIKTIDYASGAGHFLTEYANQISDIVPEEQVSEYRENTHGIEKEYRLSKVAKVSSFMYGQDEIKIKYADALKPHDDVKAGDYSIVIANPPYSVKGFLATLTERERQQFEMYEYVNDVETSNSIEVFFIELTNKLLKSEGVAGIILPSSILSNGTKLYMEARKFIIRNFNIISIVEFGARTFGSTGTNTVVLFLRKRKYPPKESKHYKYLIDRWFDNNQVQPEDVEAIKQYTNHINIDYEDYTGLQTKNIDSLKNYDLINQYITDFSKTPISKRLNKKKTNGKYTKDIKEQELYRELVNYILDSEKEKAYYFLLMHNQKTPVVVVKSPTKSREEKEFLGYEWSKRRGQEGIKYLGANLSDEEMDVSKNQAIYSLRTPLINPTDLEDNTKINTLIKNSFNGESIEVPEYLEEYVEIHKLKNMIGFDYTNFDAQIKTSVPEIIETKHPLVKLGKVVNVLIGGTPSREVNRYFEGDNPWVSISEMNGDIITDTEEKISDEAVRDSNVKLIPQGTTLLSFKLSIGKTAIAGRDLYTNEAIAGLIPKDEKEITNEYLFALFDSKIIDLESVSSKAFGKSLNSDYLKNEVLVPLPPIDEQEEIVERFREKSEEVIKYREKIETFKDNINEIIAEAEDYDQSLVSLSSNDFDIRLGKRVVSHEFTEEGIPVISANLNEPLGLIDAELLEDFEQPSVLWAIDGDWDVRLIDRDIPFYPTDHAGVIRINNDEIDPRFFAQRLYEAGVEQRFTRANRPSTNRIERLRLSFPEYDVQRSIMDKVDKLEKEICLFNEKIAKLEDEKRQIINDYL